MVSRHQRSSGQGEDQQNPRTAHPRKLPERGKAKGKENNRQIQEKNLRKNETLKSRLYWRSSGNSLEPCILAGKHSRKGINGSGLVRGKNGKHEIRSTKAWH